MIGSIIGGSILGASALGSSLLGGLLNQAQSDSNNRLSQEMFERNLAWQQQMWREQVELANTAHQREVKDLRAAGLNPILSATGGSGLNTPSGLGGSSIPALQQADWSSALQGATSGLLGGISAIADLEKIDSQKAVDASTVAKNLQDAASSKLLAPRQAQLMADQARAASSQSILNLSKSNNLDAVTPAQARLIANQANEAVVRTRNASIEGNWKEKQIIDKLANSAAMRSNLKHQTVNRYINSVGNQAKNISNIIHDWKNPFSGFMRGLSRSVSPVEGSSWSPSDTYFDSIFSN